MKAKQLLERNFTVDNDYKKPVIESKIKSRGGHNKETFLLSVKTFKSLCLKAGTKRSDQIHDIYLKIQDITLQLEEEANSELKQQLSSAEKLIETSEEDKYKLREKNPYRTFSKKHSMLLLWYY